VTLGSLVLVACSSDARVARLERRVDSLAVTLTALLASRAGGPPPAADTTTVSIAGIGPFAGAPDAPVVIVEFTDYQCPYCARHHETTLPELRASYINTGKARYVVRDLPIAQIHPHALGAATASRCAAAQGDAHYWRYHDALFARQPDLADSVWPALARRLGLDGAAFEACLRSVDARRLVERDVAEARRVGLSGTPAFVIGRAGGTTVKGVLIRGAYPFALFQQVIDSALTAAAARR
jgi:protein-disulfide isomerase